jgi:hypothetical protein
MKGRTANNRWTRPIRGIPRVENRSEQIRRQQAGNRQRGRSPASKLSALPRFYDHMRAKASDRVLERPPMKSHVLLLASVVASYPTPAHTDAHGAEVGPLCQHGAG